MLRVKGGGGTDPWDPANLGWFCAVGIRVTNVGENEEHRGNIHRTNNPIK